ncbi:hypothetical protein SM14VA4_50010 (plasmid) [Serratia marcescens]|nr:hypothetical protein SM14VA4_50010 [Serratia marcescens]
MRLITIDFLKIMSIFLVIMSHVTLFFLLSNPNDVFLYFFRQSGQLGVTVFFMCSGFFLLNNKKDEQVAYIFNKVNKILFVVFFWIIFYYVYDMFLLSRITRIEPVSILQFFNVSATTSEATHLWFIFSIIGLYILTPLIKGSFVLSNRKNISKIIIVMVCISNLTLVNALTDHLFSFSLVPFNILLPFQTEGLISFLIGGYLGLDTEFAHKFKESKAKLILLLMVSFSLLSILSSKSGMVLFYGKFYNIFLQVSSVCLFLLVFNIKVDNPSSYTTSISNNILGIYLVHNIFVIEIHGSFLHKFILHTISWLNIYIYIFIYSTLSFILSYLLCILLRKNKLTSKLITL